MLIRLCDFYKIVKMKRSKLVLIAFGIVALLGLIDGIDCKKEKPCMFQEAKIQRKEFLDGYMLEQTEPFKRTFRHDSRINTDWLDTNGTLYIDNGCDGAIDRIHLSGWYQRGSYGKEKMFEEADKYLKKAKIEMGVN